MALTRKLAPALALLLVFGQGAPALAAKAERVKGAATVKLDPEKGDVRASVNALAQLLGAQVVGDSPLLSQPAPAAEMTGTPERLLQRLLRNQDYVLKTDDKGAIKQVVIMSGAQGRDPVRAPATTTASAGEVKPLSPGAAAPASSPVVAAMVANAQLAQQQQPYQSSSPVEPVKPPPPYNPGVTAPPVPSTSSAAPVNITPEMQAQIAASTKAAQAQLDTLVKQLREACPSGERC